jgi:hypothetical protein
MCDGTNHSYTCLSNEELNDLIMQRARHYLELSSDKFDCPDKRLEWANTQLNKEFSSLGDELKINVIPTDHEECSADKSKGR